LQRRRQDSACIPPASDEEPDQAETEEAMATALLSEAAIDTDDLAAIVTGPDAKAKDPARPLRRSQQPRNQQRPGRNTKRGNHEG